MSIASLWDSSFGGLQKIGKALMLPVSVLPVAGILLGVGSSIVGSDGLSPWLLDLGQIMKASKGQERSWDDVPEDIRRTYDRLGIPEAEKKYLSGVKAQYESEVVYGSLQEDLAKQGVLFTDTDSALQTVQ